MSEDHPAFTCEICHGHNPRWRVLRRGDVVVSWACDPHLAQVARRLQRDWEITELVVTDQIKAREWSEINRSLRPEWT